MNTEYTPDPSVKKQWVLDAQWSDTPEDVLDEIREAWMDYELGNDHYIFKIKIGVGISEGDFPKITNWCRANGVPDGEIVWIHWWW